MLLILAGAAALASGGSDANTVIGKWRIPVRGGVVDITRCGESLCGRLIESDGLRANPDLRDTNNKDTGQRDRRLQNVLMLQGFRWNGGAWGNGTIYNAEDGGTYKATITPVDANHLKLKGCIVWPLCKTQNWTRMR